MDTLNAIRATSDLPVIVTQPGDYVTRDGRRVTIHEVTQAMEYTYRAKGAFWKMYRGKVRPRGFQAWHVSGRLDVVRETAGDIVGPWLSDPDLANFFRVWMNDFISVKGFAGQYGWSEAFAVSVIERGRAAHNAHAERT